MEEGPASAAEPRPPSAGGWLLTAAVALAGPVAAAAYEGGVLPTPGLDGLGTLVPVIVVAAAGAGVALWATRRPPRWMGVAGLLTNGAVLAVYGFLLLFFGLGGSR